MWFGGNDHSIEGTWTWSHTGDAVTYWDAWYPNEPNNGGGGAEENCMGTMSWENGWNDRTCHDLMYALCES